MKSTRGLLLLSALAVLAATASCSSPSPQGAGSDAGSVSGTVSGHALAVTDGIGVLDPTAAIPHVFVVLGDRSPLCALLLKAGSTAAAANQVAGLGSLEMHLYDQRTTAISPGTFPVPTLDASAASPLEADIFFTVLDGSCAMSARQLATSGTVTLTSVQPSAAGTYDLHFGPDHITGAFDVSYCNGVNVQGTGSSGAAVCTP